MRLADLIIKYVEAKTELDKAHKNCGDTCANFPYDEAERCDLLADEIDAKVKELCPVRW